MPIDARTAGSPGWWFDRLLKQLGERQNDYNTLESYFEGTNQVPITASKVVRQAYRRLMEMARTNYAELVTEAVRERMSPIGFRTGAASDELGDEEAWRIWQANQLDADSGLVHRAMLSMRESYVIVGGIDPEIEAPLITIEDPRQVITAHDPRRRRKTIAALKVFREGTLDIGYLYLPGVVYRAERENMSEEGQSWDVGGWEQVSKAVLPFPVVPVVRFANRENVRGAALAEFEPHIAVLDRINYTILSRLEIATLQAFRQRAIKGVPDRNADGTEIDYDDIFESSPGALWVLPQTAEIWESQQIDLGPIRQAVRDDVQDLAAASRTPLFYLTPDAAQGSAEGASLAREGLVFKTQDRLVQTGEPWEQVMSLAFLFAGDETRARRADMEIMWADPQRYSLAERLDAASKAVSAGVPKETIWSSILQYTPQEIARMRTQQADEALLAPTVGEPVNAAAAV